VLITSSGSELAEGFLELCAFMYTSWLPPIPNLPDIISRCPEILMTDELSAAKGALAFIQNCYSNRSSQHVQFLLRNLPIAPSLIACAQRFGVAIFPSVVLAIANMAATSKNDRDLLISCCSFDQLRILITAVSSVPQLSATISVLLNGLTAYKLLPEDATSLVKCAAALRPYIGRKAILTIARCAQWTPRFPQLAASLGIIEDCVGALEGDRPSEIQTGLIVLSYGGFGLFPKICELAFCADEEVASCALWYIGQHLSKSPADCPAVLSLGVLNVIAQAFDHGSFRIRTESALLIARIIQAFPDICAQIGPFIPPLGEVLGVSSEPALVIPLLAALETVAASGVDIFDDDVIGALESLSEHERADVARYARAILETP
jgi:hypothetical protein